MLRDRIVLFQSDDKSWAQKMEKKDEAAKAKLKIQLEKAKREHPGPKVTVYAPPEPDVPPPSGTTKINTSVEMPVPYKDD